MLTPIRTANMHDLDAVVEVVRSAIRHMDDQGIPQWDDIYPSKPLLQVDIEKQHMYVIEDTETIAGFITVNEDQSPEYEEATWSYPGRVFVVHRLTIRPSYQRKGLASQLMDFAENQATSTGYDTIRLDAFTQNPAAVALYEKRGYRKAGTVRFRKGIFFCFEKAVNLLSKTEGSNKAPEATV